MERCMCESVSTCSDLNMLTGCNFDDASLFYDGNSAIQGMWSPTCLNLSPSENISSSLGYINHVSMEDDLKMKACQIQDATTLNAIEQEFYDLEYDNREPLWFQDSINRSSGTDINSFQSSSHACLLPGEDNELPEFHTGLLSSGDTFSSPGGLTELDQEVLANGNNMNGGEDNELPEFHTCLLSSGDTFSSPGGLTELDQEVLANDGNNMNGEVALEVEIKSYEENHVPLSPESYSMIRKSLGWDDDEVEDESMRRNKQLAMSPSDPEKFILHELFSKMQNLWGGKYDHKSMKSSDSICSKKISSRREEVDTINLVLKYVESIARNDQTTANRFLKQIRFVSSLNGDGSQRLAHFFANALEVRIANSGFPGYKDVVGKEDIFSDTSVLKALELFLSKFPFVVTSYLFASDMIMRFSDKATSIHILHFGIVHGLQWFPFIERLAARTGGPPKLRITGIDIPQAGFKPAARVEETGRRLASYCEKFGVPFKYKAIAAKWENINAIGLDLKEDETLIVNCLYQFMYLQDGTVSEKSAVEKNPRDDVLKLIRGIKPSLFIHGVLNAAFSSPYIVQRTREALYHYSSFFNMYDVVVADRDNQERMVLERELLGKEILNVIACEDVERIQRPETYIQWEARTKRAGFMKVSLGNETVEKLKSMVASNYHKNFLIKDSNEWILQGWKSRTPRSLFALSCWKPA